MKRIKYIALAFAVFVIRDIVGVKAVDARNRTVDIRPPSDLPVSWCSLKLPVGSEVLEMGWRREGGKIRVQLPDGWQAIRNNAKP